MYHLLALLVITVAIAIFMKYKSKESMEDIVNVEVDDIMDSRRAVEVNSVADDTAIKVAYDQPREQQKPLEDWNKLFDKSNNIIRANSEEEETKLEPSKLSTGMYAKFVGNKSHPCQEGKSCQPEDIFNIDNMLPQESKSDWFENVPEAISSKNINLIQTSRMTGVNNVTTSRRNTNWDLRGEIPVKKENVSIFNNSSYDTSAFNNNIYA